MDLQLASRLAEASQAAYQQYPRLAGYTTYPVSHGATQAFLFVNRREVILVFRGTQPLGFWDIYHDIRLRRVRLGATPGRYHRGFVRALDKVWSQLRVRVMNLSRTRRVYVAGHSLGGALATMFVLRLEAEFPAVAAAVRGVYTFGAPRALNRKAAQWAARVLGPRLVAVQARGDYIPHLPPAALGYWAAGTKHLIGPHRRWSIRRHRMAYYRRHLEETS